jgi:hypothetical protein
MAMSQLGKGLFDGAEDEDQSVLAPPKRSLASRAVRGAGGVLGAVSKGLGRISAGEDDPNLSSDENARARRRAMMMGGLATLAENNRPGGNRGIGAFAEGAMLGQKVGDQGRQGAHRQNAMARMQEMFGEGTPTPEQLQSMMVQLLIAGDNEGAKALAEVIKASSGSIPNLGVLDLGATKLLYNQRSGEPVREYGATEDLQSRDVGNAIQYFNPSDPSRVVFSVPKGMNPDQAAQLQMQNQATLSGQWQQVTQNAQAIAQAYSTFRAADNSISGDQTRAIALAKMIHPAVRTNEEALEAISGSGLMGTAISRFRRVFSGEGQLDDQTRAELASQAERIYRSTRDHVSSALMPSYRARARAAGIPLTIFIDPFAQTDGGGGQFNDLIPRQ